MSELDDLFIDQQEAQKMRQQKPKPQQQKRHRTLANLEQRAIINRMAQAYNIPFEEAYRAVNKAIRTGVSWGKRVPHGQPPCRITDESGADAWIRSHFHVTVVSEQVAALVCCVAGCALDEDAAKYGAGTVRRYICDAHVQAGWHFDKTGILHAPHGGTGDADVFSLGIKIAKALTSGE